MVASTVYEREIGVAVVYPTLNKMSKMVTTVYARDMHHLTGEGEKSFGIQNS